jgi:predicted TIM-barrel fold metal-dependent hydrolase
MLLYGTDWPLVPMGAYIDFIKKIVPPEHYEEVFYKNAVRVYKLDV